MRDGYKWASALPKPGAHLPVLSWILFLSLHVRPVPGSRSLFCFDLPLRSTHPSSVRFMSRVKCPLNSHFLLFSFVLTRVHSEQACVWGRSLRAQPYRTTATEASPTLLTLHGIIANVNSTFESLSCTAFPKANACNWAFLILEMLVDRDEIQSGGRPGHPSSGLPADKTPLRSCFSGFSYV